MRCIMFPGPTNTSEVSLPNAIDIWQPPVDFQQVLHMELFMPVQDVFLLFFRHLEAFPLHILCPSVLVQLLAYYHLVVWPSIFLHKYKRLLQFFDLPCPLLPRCHRVVQNVSRVQKNRLVVYFFGGKCV